MSNDITLTAEDGHLHIPGAEHGGLLIVRYPAGDCDLVAWPNPDADNLAAALYDAREMGEIPDGATVRTPDGNVVYF